MKKIDFEVSDFFELTPDLVWIAGKDGFLKKVNPAVIAKLGYTEEELYSKPSSTFIHPEDRGITLQNRVKLFKGEVLHNFCNRYITKAGKIVWLEWTSIYGAKKEIVFAIAKDITVRKQIEKDVEEEYNKYKNLATHFKSSLEKDRKYFAYELHEELAQLIAVVNMDVSWLASNTTDMPGKFKSRVDHAYAVTKLLIKSIQKLSFTISPQMLDDFGLTVTLEWLCKEFSILYGINCEFEGVYNESDLSQEIKMDFFRICQDSLSGIINHDQAENVRIKIEEVDDAVHLSITDSGNGFYADKEYQLNGLVNVRERAASINAQVKVNSDPAAVKGIFIKMKKKYLPVK